MPSQDPLRQPSPAAARLAGTVVLAIALAALIGFAADVTVLQRPLARTAPMSPLTATALGLLAIAVLLLTAGDRARSAAGALAVVAGLIGLLSAVDHALGTMLDLNRRIFGADALMALSTAAALTLLGAALTAHAVVPALRGAARVATLAAGALGSAALLGYALGVEFFFTEGRMVQMAPHTAVSVALMAGAILLLRPGVRTRVITGPSLGGRFARTFLPLVLGVQVLSGVLATQGVQGDLWSFSTAVWLMALTSLGSLLTLVVWGAQRLHHEDERRAEYERELTTLAARDALTGTYNRRAFDAELERAVQRALRYGDALAVCVIDLDRFKALNDRHGHAAGDQALLRVARALRGRLRSTDVLGRIGGDEFAAALSHVDETGARRIARDLGAAVEQVGAELTAEGFDNDLAASVGLARHREGEPAATLLQRADERMYAVKRAGRAA